MKKAITQRFPEMKLSSIYRLLEFPLIYSLVQRLLAPGAGLLLKKHFRQFFNESKGLVLDVGCGPVLNTPRPHGIIVGVDINPSYLRKYLKSGAGSNLYNINSKLIYFGVVSSADVLPFNNNTFDEIRSIGLLHHLPEESALLTIKEMYRCVRPEGKIVIFDNVWPRVPLYRPIAFLMRKLDCGKWVRTEEELLKLISISYKGDYKHKRFTYSFIGHEGLILQIEKHKDI